MRPVSPTRSAKQAGLFSPRGTDGMKTSCSRAVRSLVMGLVLVVCVLMGVFAGSAVAWELPEGRVYEMVTPPYKADYGVDKGRGAVAAAPDGESVVFTSLGAFGGATSEYLDAHYVARRGASGWVTSATAPPPAEGRLPDNRLDYSPDLCRQVALMGSKVGKEDVGTSAVVLSDMCEGETSFVQAWPLPDGPATFPGTGLAATQYVGASADLTHLVFDEYEGGLYQISGLGGPEPKEEDVAVVGQPDGPGGSILPRCPDPSFETSVYTYGRAHVISMDGSEIFFELCHVGYVRVNNAATFALGGVFDGASADGSKAFVSGGGLSMDVIDGEPGHEALSVVPIDPGPGAASVVASSDDGSHVYFTSPDVLAGPNVRGGSPQAGASNLYVYDSVARETAFVEVAEVAEVNRNDEVGHYEAQTTPDGRFLVFTTHARLTADDTDTAADVYRYDAQTGGLLRVSLGEGGHDDNGNDNAFNASIAVSTLEGHQDRAIETWRLDTRAISDDGSTIVFSSAEPLSPRALNGNENIYVWHEGGSEGRVGMISTGLSQSGDEAPVVSASGRDVFFVTAQDILPQDSDGLTDIYDARVGGGFPEPAVPAGGCSGDTCQGPPSVPSLLGAPASAAFHGLGNPVASSSTVVLAAKAKSKAKCKRGYVLGKRGRCVKVKRRARKAATGRVRAHHSSSRGGRS